MFLFFFFQAEDGIRDIGVTGVQTCALPIWAGAVAALIYALNPNFVYFDTQYGYETLSIGLIVWALVCLSRMQRALTDGEIGRRRVGKECRSRWSADE